LGRYAWQQGGGFRRAPGLRCSPQQREIVQPAKLNVKIDGRRDACAGRSFFE
jgi:hypothetical protein